MWCSRPCNDLLALPAAFCLQSSQPFALGAARTAFGPPFSGDFQVVFVAVFVPIKTFVNHPRINLRASSASILSDQILCGSNSRLALWDLISPPLHHFRRSEIRAVRRCFDLFSSILDLCNQVSALQNSTSAHARWILIGRSYFSAAVARISDPFAHFRIVSRGLEFIQSSPVALASCILVCVLCARLLLVSILP